MSSVSKLKLENGAVVFDSVLRSPLECITLKSRAFEAHTTNFERDVINSLFSNRLQHTRPVFMAVRSINLCELTAIVDAMPA